MKKRKKERGAIIPSRLTKTCTGERDLSLIMMASIARALFPVVLPAIRAHPKVRMPASQLMVLHDTAEVAPRERNAPHPLLRLPVGDSGSSLAKAAAFAARPPGLLALQHLTLELIRHIHGRAARSLDDSAQNQF